MSTRHVLLVCPGLDHAHRGFETFARECFETLRDRDDIRIELVKGSGRRARAERAVPTLLRDTALARRIARAASWEPFLVEHLTFALALIPLLLRRRPEVVFFSEWHVGRVLAAWRAISRQSFALVLSNGALAPGGYGHLDRVQQLVPGAIEYTVERGEPRAGQVLLPLGVAMPSQAPRPLPAAELESLRLRLGLPVGRPVVFSAAAINRQKRIDYLIEEIASMPEPRPYLLVAGQQGAESAAIRQLALERLGRDGHSLRTVHPSEMPDLYRASDAFVLASLWESFGRVLVEALSHGVPCLAHDYPVMSWVLGGQGDVADLEAPGAVGRWLSELPADALSPERRERRWRAVHERFSWPALASSYVELLAA